MELKLKNVIKYSKPQATILLIIRLVVGYHFLFEGFDKLYSGTWTSAAFLLQANWLFSSFFHFLGNSSTLLAIVDYLNIFGQILIGISLIVGLRSTLAAYLGALMILMYYIAIPPFISSFTFIDKNLFELLLLVIIALYPTSNIIGIDMLINKFRSNSNG